MNTARTCLAAATVLATSIAAGSATAQEPATVPPVVTLTLGTDDSPGVPSADEILHFAAEVSRLSDGQVVIEPAWHAEGDGHPDWDQAVAKLVQDGDLDMALGPTWAWDVLGVTSLTPLMSPFLVDSDELVASIVTDEALPAQLTSGLADAGVEGIMLWPEGLRHPFGFAAPLTSVDDFTGQVVRSPVSDTVSSVFDALGATTSPDEPDATTMVGMQSEYALSPNGTGAANITFFPKVNVLYANADVYSDLDPATRELLAEAATATQAWAIDRTDDVVAGETFCSEGGALINATDDDVSGLRVATAPVADEIAAAHPEAVAAIVDLKSALAEPQTAAPCGVTPDSTPDETAGANESELNGTYRFMITKQESLDFGASEDWANNNAGVQTYVLDDGVVTFQLDPSERAAGPDDSFEGTYDVDGDVITLHWPALDNETDELRFAVAADGDLQMTLLDTNGEFGGMEFLLASKVWDKIG